MVTPYVSCTSWLQTSLSHSDFANTVFPPISARALVKNFGRKGGRLLEGGRLIEGGALIKFFFTIVEFTGPRRLENGLAVPGKFTASIKTAAIGKK